jgi:hypothetical protein
MHTRSLKYLALAMAMALFLVPTVFAQGSGTSLGGRVVDDQGAAIPGVTVTATNADTGFQRVTVTTARTTSSPFRSAPTTWWPSCRDSQP